MGVWDKLRTGRQREREQAGQRREDAERSGVRERGGAEPAREYEGLCG